MQIVGNLTVPNQSYNNKKYTSMPAEAKEFYDVLLDIYKTQQKKLGKGGMSQNSWDNFSYILPSVRKSALDIGLEGNPIGGPGAMGAEGCNEGHGSSTATASGDFDDIYADPDADYYEPQGPGNPWPDNNIKECD